MKKLKVGTVLIQAEEVAVVGVSYKSHETGKDYFVEIAISRFIINPETLMTEKIINRNEYQISKEEFERFAMELFE